MSDPCPYCGKANNNTHNQHVCYIIHDSIGRTAELRPGDWCNGCYGRLRKQIFGENRTATMEEFLRAARGDLHLKWMWKFRKVDDGKEVIFDGDSPCPKEWTNKETEVWGEKTYHRYPNGIGMERYFHRFDTNWSHTVAVYLHREVWWEANQYSYREGFPKKTVIHHIDHNFLNNDISNLELMTEDEHLAHHGFPTKEVKKPRPAAKPRIKRAARPPKLLFTFDE